MPERQEDGLDHPHGFIVDPAQPRRPRWEPVNSEKAGSRPPSAAAIGSARPCLSEQATPPALLGRRLARDLRWRLAGSRRFLRHSDFGAAVAASYRVQRVASRGHHLRLALWTNENHRSLLRRRTTSSPARPLHGQITPTAYGAGSGAASGSA